MSSKFEMDVEKYDDAVMRIDCAANLLTVIGVQYDEPGCMFSNEVMRMAIFGISMLVEDAQKQLVGR